MINEILKKLLDEEESENKTEPNAEKEVSVKVIKPGEKKVKDIFSDEGEEPEGAYDNEEGNNEMSDISGDEVPQMELKVNGEVMTDPKKIMKYLSKFNI